MRSEHLENLHLGWVLGGWAVAAVVTGAVYLGLTGLGMVASGTGALAGLAAATAVGFFVGGLMVGMRWCDAPILHAAAITLVSTLLWFLGSLALPGETEVLGREAPAILGLILLQFVAATLGGRFGRRVTLGIDGGEEDA